MLNPYLIDINNQVFKNYEFALVEAWSDVFNILWQLQYWDEKKKP